MRRPSMCDPRPVKPGSIDARQDGVEIRRAEPADIAAILQLARRSLGWRGGEDDAAFFTWKHKHNPFGTSPMWVATHGDRIVGFRTFLRWEFVRPGGEHLRAVRAVDTATDPEYQGRGIFTELTLHALDDLRADGSQVVFNTPNDRSRPGYLKMGWNEIGRIPIQIRPTGLRSFPRIVTARVAAELASVPSRAGEDAAQILQDEDAVDALLASLPATSGIATLRSAAYLSWRYSHPQLSYRVLLRGSSLTNGMLVFRVRRRGPAREAVVCELLVPESAPLAAGDLIRKLLGSMDADYAIRIGNAPFDRAGFVRVPAQGPVLTALAIAPVDLPSITGWNMQLGDVELF